MKETRQTVYENQYARVDRVPGKNKLAFDVIIKGSGKTALSVKSKNNAINYAKRLLDYSSLYS